MRCTQVEFFCNCFFLRQMDRQNQLLNPAHPYVAWGENVLSTSAMGHCIWSLRLRLMLSEWIVIIAINYILGEWISVLNVPNPRVNCSQWGYKSSSGQIAGLVATWLACLHATWVMEFFGCLYLYGLYTKTWTNDPVLVKVHTPSHRLKFGTSWDQDLLNTTQMLSPLSYWSPLAEE